MSEVPLYLAAMLDFIGLQIHRHQHHPQEQLLRRNVNRFREGLVFKADRLLYHSTLGLRGIKKKKTLFVCLCLTLSRTLFHSLSRSLSL